MLNWILITDWASYLRIYMGNYRKMRKSLLVWRHFINVPLTLETKCGKNVSQSKVEEPFDWACKSAWSKATYIHAMHVRMGVVVGRMPKLVALATKSIGARNRLNALVPGCGERQKDTSSKHLRLTSARTYKYICVCVCMCVYGINSGVHSPDSSRIGEHKAREV